MLTQHPDIVRRLREEILDTVGCGRPTFERMKEMKYLRAFINGTPNYFLKFRSLSYIVYLIETLRLYPAVYVHLRLSPLGFAGLYESCLLIQSVEQ